MESLATILRDPMARTLLAILAISLTMLTLWLRRKALTYEVSETRVLSVHEEVKGRVQIFFDEKPARDVCLVMITIKNSGRVPIRAADFERNLLFRWEEAVQILSAEVVNAKPKDLRPVVKAGGNEVVLEPLLLNGGDKFQLKALINQSGTLSVDGRIAGVQHIRRIMTDPETTRLVMLILMCSILMLVVALLGEVAGLWTRDSKPELVLVVSLLGLGLFIFLQLLKRNIAGLIGSYSGKPK